MHFILIIGSVERNPGPRSDYDTDHSFSENIIRKDRNDFGCGINIYTKDDISVTKKGVHENHTDETLWLEIRGQGEQVFFYYTVPTEPNGQV